MTLSYYIKQYNVLISRHQIRQSLIIFKSSNLLLI